LRQKKEHDVNLEAK